MDVRVGLFSRRLGDLVIGEGVKEKQEGMSYVVMLFVRRYSISWSPWEWSSSPVRQSRLRGRRRRWCRRGLAAQLRGVSSIHGAVWSFPAPQRPWQPVYGCRLPLSKNGNYWTQEGDSGAGESLPTTINWRNNSVFSGDSRRNCRVLLSGCHNTTTVIWTVWQRPTVTTFLSDTDQTLDSVHSLTTRHRQ